MERGRYIVIEGGEGVGKTTQVERLGARLERVGHRAVHVREPGGDPFAEAGRALLLGDLPREPETEVLLFNALRAQVLLTRVLPALDAGTWVVADRSRLSTITYQGYGHGVDLPWTRAVCAAATEVCRPDLEIVLRVDEAVSAARRADRGTTDRFEQLDQAFHRCVIAGYEQEAAADGLPLLEAGGSVDEVELLIWAAVQERFPAELA